MARTRAFRRFQMDKARAKAHRLWTKIWRMKDLTRLGWPPLEPPTSWLHLWAETHCRPCSCPMCGNPRRHWGERTVQERRAGVGRCRPERWAPRRVDHVRLWD